MKFLSLMIPFSQPIIELEVTTMYMAKEKQLSIPTIIKGKFLIKLKKYDMSLLFMAIPLLILVFVFAYLPLYGWIYSFFRYQPGVPLANTEFVGFKYFIMVFSRGNDSLNAIKNTLIFSVLNILVSPLPIVFAIMLSEVKKSKFSKIVQTVTSFPNFISWVLVYSVFFSFLSNEGLINEILIKTGLIKESMNVLANENIVYIFQTLVGIWKNLGWSAIIYIAAISSIDQELYCAAEVDGAGRFGKIIHITLPGVMSTFIVLLLLAVGNMLNNGFEQYYVFKNPVTEQTIEVLDTFLYRVGLGRAQYAYSIAVGMFKSVVSIILLFTVNFISKRTRGESII